MLLSTFKHFPDLFNYSRQKLQVSLIFGDNLFPVPLIHIGAMIMIEEIVSAHSTHISIQSFANIKSELFQCHPFPFGFCLYNLGFDGMLVIIVLNVELDGSTRAIPVKVVINATLYIYDQRTLNPYQVKFLTKMLLDVLFDRSDRILCLLWV